jgi:6,7-dimethyl-8-ribityllumazine synthase
MTLAVLTTDTLEQAVDRAGGKHGNAGWNAAVALVELMAQFRS